MNGIMVQSIDVRKIKSMGTLSALIGIHHRDNYKIKNNLNPYECGRELLSAICMSSGVSLSDVLGTNRAIELVNVRRMFCYLMWNNFPNFKKKNIGRMIGGKDHSTVIYHIRKHKDNIKYDEVYTEMYRRVTTDILCGLSFTLKRF